MKIDTSQLFINDTSCSSWDIARIIPSKTIVVDLAELTENLNPDVLKKTSNLILPGSGSNILLEAFWINKQELLNTLSISVSRKLQWLTPRWLDILDSDKQTLSSIQTDRIIADDVVASGTTVNGIYKAIWSKSTWSIFTLVLRNPSDIKKNIPIQYGALVSNSEWWFTRINTLSTVSQDTKKAKAVLDWRRKFYWNTFVNDMLSILSS